MPFLQLSIERNAGHWHNYVQYREGNTSKSIYQKKYREGYTSGGINFIWSVYVISIFVDAFHFI